jgi:hypothetical protein
VDVESDKEIRIFGDVDVESDKEIRISRTHSSLP